MLQKFHNLNNPEYTINARKFDGTLNRTWKCELLEQKESLYLFKGIFEKEVNHVDIGLIRRGTFSYEYYWLDCWFNVFKFYEPSGEFKCFYCNINLPPIISNYILDYVDLDLDILVDKDSSYKILDEEEFQFNIKKFNYSQELIKNVRSSVDLL